ncbi:Uncharacterized conserved protein, DUF58 family, contains vWF domain [Raineyella antarctica]|uniref:Uncharacterized conserved protein, DUF58 family, contains vWF domain n=1 Tax=Raineyella antarctica TaxID=1577474 RepID=A0A1G6GDS6_9ACTN|nr:DUF58 domain-containing protein [Raineyella antarctica]SDB80151.1 Uncharacterized conserved protein, DUF58 family, contains vWF domain [Raineyella antarctica]
MRIPLRNPWSLMTLRGKVTFVSGAAIAVLAALFGQRDVLLLGLLLVLVPICSAVFVDRTRLKLSSERKVTPSQAAIGEELSGSLVLDRHGKLPVGVLRFEDQVPPQLGVRPRFTLQNLAAEWSREVTYPLHGQQRGRFRVGPLRVRVSDPFGLASLDRQFNATSEVMVTPRIVPLDAMGNAGGSGSTGEARPQRLGLSGQDDILVREYVRGDDVRRVHWRSTARHGELMVRQEEQAWDPSATVVLDTRASAHRGEGPESSFEWAVSMIASLTVHLLADGYAITLFGADGPLMDPELGDLGTMTSRREAITQLTDVTPSDSSGLDRAAAASLRATSSQMTIAVLGQIRSADAAHLVEMQRNQSHAMAWVLDVQDWEPPEDRVPAATRALREDHDRAVEMLGHAGWRVVRVPGGTSVHEAWLRMSRMGEQL